MTNATIIGSEYPIVQGHLSVQVYMNAMQKCYTTLREKIAARYGYEDMNYRDFQYFCFHTPFSKQV